MQDNTNVHTINRLWNKCASLINSKNRLEAEIAEIDHRNKLALYEYRAESTARVLTFILAEYRDGKLPDLETLLVHCLNKLRGNIDGVELSLRDLQSKEIAVLPLTTATSSGQEEKCYGQHDR